MSWAAYYAHRINNKEYTKYFNQRYAPFLNCLRKAIAKDSKVCEYGCGTGMVTTQILIPEVTFSACDIDTGMLNLARQHLNIPLFKHSILSRPVAKVDVIHSHGVLEHFHPNQIKSIISQQKKWAQTLIHYVPSSKYTKVAFGDEHLWSKEQWQALVRPDNIVEFNEGKDLILCWNNLSV